MTEGDKGYIFHFERIFLHPSAVLYDFDGIEVLTIFDDGVLVMQVSAQIAIGGHGIEPNGQVFRRQRATHILHILQTSVVERFETAPPERTVHAVVSSVITAP